MGKYFGTDGVRGEANRTLTTKMAYELGRAGAHALTTLNHRPTILVGKDTRLSGDMLEAALIAGMCEVGADVARAGVLPTPAVAHLTRAYNMDAGVVISASHNPYYDNGIKFFNSEGYKLSDSIEDEIERLIDLGCPSAAKLQGDIGREVPASGLGEAYLRHLTAVCKQDLSGMEFVLDCANGAAGAFAPEAFLRLGAKVRAYNCSPNGVNINDGCGSTHIGALEALCRDHGCAGFAFDGDADRVIAVDEDGCEVDGDYILAICAAELSEQGRLAGQTVVATVMSNIGLDEALSAIGARLERTAVGDRYVLERMLDKGYVLGGEASGHIICLDHATTGDGTLAAIITAAAMRRRGVPLRELKRCMRKYPQIIVNVHVERALMGLKDSPAVKDAIAAAETAMAGAGRVLVRPSGTEPLIRIMLEGPDNDMIARYADTIKQAILAECRKSVHSG